MVYNDENTVEMVVGSMKVDNRPSLPKREATKNYAIAYLDMLGTTSKISNDKDGLYLSHIRSFYRTASFIRSHKRLRKLSDVRIEIKIFSDNIILAIPLDSNHAADRIDLLLILVAILQYWSARKYNWLVRGGITIGELYIDKYLVWGSGLVRAYNLESKIAIFPRIVVDHNVLKTFGNDSILLSQDIDGQTFISFLEVVEYLDSKREGDSVEAIKTSFAALLSEIKKPDGSYEERAYQKLQWYRNYINTWSKQKYPELDTPLIEDPQMD
jgi:hypothetical protein